MKSAERRRPGWVYALLAVAAMAAAGIAPAQAQQQGASDASAPQEKLFSGEQLEQMMAPIALYPDSLLSQILMASTYPSSVAEAAAWSAEHKDDKGDEAVKKVQDKPWDPSVMSLVAFPQVLAQLKDQPDWVQKTGDAFLAQPKDVMDAIQRLRAKAQKAGNLKSNEQQTVTVEPAPPPDPGAPAPTSTTNTTVIQIEPANPQTVYVPSYNPTTVYGSWAYPSYPPPYWPPPPYYYPLGGALATGLMWGAGIAVANSLWGGCNWGHGDVNINSNRYNNINTGNNRINGGGNQNWKHNANNRRGTPYADRGNRQQNGVGQNRGNAGSRDQFRGRQGGAGGGDARRQNAASTFNSRTGNQGGGNFGGRSEYGGGGNRGASAGNRSASSAGAGSRGGGAGASQRSAGGSQRSAGASQRSASQGARSNAMSGASSRNSGAAASRGQSSFSSSRSGGGSRGGGGGRQVSRSAPSRGGGGGGGRRR
jgi:hypothetical protein